MQMMESETRGGRIHGFKEIGIHDGMRTDEDLLLREITHRINNELTSTIGLVALTAARSGNDEVKTAMAGVIQHIRDFASVHRSLQMPGDDHPIDAAVYLRDLCRSISVARLQYKNIELLFRESPLNLGAQRCWRMGMILSELIANASRHAFHGDGGSIEVVLSSHGLLTECTVSDNGSAAANVLPGQGMKIVRALAGDLHGSIDHCFGPRGTIVTLSFPLVEPGGADPGRLSFGCVNPVEPTTNEVSFNPQPGDQS
jgi:two-component sensor histidine kinase